MSDSTANQDPFGPLRDAYGQVVENWSAAMEQVVSTEEFASASGRFLQQYAELHESGRLASQATANSLHIPTKDDLAQVAELVVNVERKVDEVSDEAHALRSRLDDIHGPVIALAERLTAIEAGLEKLLAEREAPKQATSGTAKKATSGARKATSGAAKKATTRRTKPNAGTS